MSGSIDVLLIGNLTGRRCQEFVAAASARPDIHLQQLSYATLLSVQAEAAISQIFTRLTSSALLIKLESPGEDFAVEKTLIALGARTSTRLDHAEALSLQQDFGRIAFINEWYQGFKQLMMDIQHWIAMRAQAQAVNVRYINTPEAVVTLFDKPLVQHRLAEHQLPVPTMVADVAEARSYEAIKAILKQKRCFKVFVKPAYGSSASGVIALQLKADDSQLQAYTSIEAMVCQGQLKLYNSLKIHRYNEIQIAAIIDALSDESIYVEQWLPKAQVDGLFFDIRMLSIQAKASHCLLRCSTWPMTNLHLGNQRRDFSILPDHQQILQRCEVLLQQVNSIFPGTNNIGFDILLSKRQRQPYILELNAFGDLLTNSLFNHRTTQQNLLESALQEFAYA